MPTLSGTRNHVRKEKVCVVSESEWPSADGEEFLETQRAVAQVYVCALHRIRCECGVQQQSHVMSFLCMGRCGVSRKRKAVASQPEGRDTRSRMHHTVLVLPLRSCREGPEHFSPTLLAFFGFASSRRVSLPSRASPEGINRPA